MWCCSPLDCKEIQPVRPKEISPEYSLEGLMLKLKLQLNTLATWCELTPQDWRQEEKGMTEDEMVGWHHWLNGHESEWAPGDGDGQGSLVCCYPWGCKESDTTERLNSSTLFYCFLLYCLSQVLCFLQIEHLWQPYLQQVHQHHFPTALGNKEKLKHECITAG